MTADIRAFAVNAALKAFSILPVKNVILFESSPDYACNTYPVYDAFRKMPEVREKYRLMWYVSDERLVPEDFPKEDIIYLEPPSLKETLRHILYRATARCTVMCNRVKNPVRKKQLSVFLCHGNGIKRLKGLYEIGKKIDFVLSQSHFFDEVMCDDLDIEKNQLFYTGYPRCDALFEDHSDLKEKFGVPEGEKLIMWLPTYRNHKNGAMETDGSGGLPVIKTSEDIEKLTAALEKYNAYLFLKPHPAQDRSVIDAHSTSRFKVISDFDLAEKGSRLYELLAASDALITDYSSVFYDYLLCDRPIGVTTDDAEEYGKTRGFAFDGVVELFSKAASLLPDISALCTFLSDVCAGRDDKSEGRCEVRALTNMYTDGKSAVRTAKFILEKLDKQ